MGFLSSDELCSRFGIALTGGIGAGKTTVSKLLEMLGYVVISADQLAREVVLPETEGYKKIVETFGSKILNEKSEIDRKKLREVVFNDDRARTTLEGITHPLIRRELSHRLEVSGLFEKPQIWFYEAPIIVEAGRHDQFREVWLLACPIQTRLLRIIKRDALEEEKALKILSAQLSDQEKARFASVIIDSSQDLSAIKSELSFHINRLKS